MNAIQNGTSNSIRAMGSCWWSPRERQGYGPRLSSRESAGVGAPRRPSSTARRDFPRFRNASENGTSARQPDGAGISPAAASGTSRPRTSRTSRPANGASIVTSRESVTPIASAPPPRGRGESSTSMVTSSVPSRAVTDSTDCPGPRVNSTSRVVWALTAKREIGALTGSPGVTMYQTKPPKAVATRSRAKARHPRSPTRVRMPRLASIGRVLSAPIARSTRSTAGRAARSAHRVPQGP